MSAEYEDSRNTAQRKDIMQKVKKNDSSNNDDDTLDDLAGSANNSIIGKVKSRVSSIIPSSFSKWFSPSARNNDSLNGSPNLGAARRRRRLEIEEDEEYDDGDNRDTNENENFSHRDYEENFDKINKDKDSDEDDTDNNSEDDFPKARSIRSTKSEFVNQPPSKRSRISFDVSSVQHQPLIASTPAVGNNHRNIISHSIDSVLSKPTPSYLISNFTEANVNSNVNSPQAATSQFSTAYVPEVKPKDTITNRMNINEKQMDSVTGISSRRTLHLPSTSLAAKEQMEFSNFKRQSIGGILDAKKLGADIPSANTSTIVADVETVNRAKQPQTFLDVKERRNLNGNTSTVVSSKKQKLNGIELPEESNADCESSSESGEDCVGNNSELPNITNLGQRKTGLFNMSNLNSQNGNKSRTSSFGNSINFYSHLEGRKSLFSGGAQCTESTNVLNNSTLSLTSLNRRQFNASIYGSTSALSDSRLLNTFSPFYKGKTTYGGAAAYKKYNSGAGSNRICNITPTIIRPTSSLSTLSSSNNSLIANPGGSNALSAQSNNGLENTSAISSTAKRILDLINDFATPLSEAKKMANTSVKANLQMLPQAKTRLNETDLQASRAMRLAQVRTPYSRPAVTLQPTIKNTTIPPPVKELQVPSMSQLLQMKKMQSTTERSRQITMQSSDSATRAIVRSGEYKLPISNENNSVDKETSQGRQQQQQQQHTNKIKSKVRSSGRVTASKNAINLEADEAPPPVNLPNIAFPLMQSVPKFDIALPKAQTSMPLDSTKSVNLPKSQLGNENSSVVGGSNKSVFTNTTPFKFSADSNKIDPTKGTNHMAEAKSIVADDKSYATGNKINFKFSAPLTFECFDANVSPQQNSNTVTKKYTFSPPSALNFEEIANASHEQAKMEVQSGKAVASQLKSGSVLDALKKPFVLPTTANEITSSSSSVTKETTIGFGDQFKKAANNKWECNTCLIRNESDVDKCVACETPRTKASTLPPTVTDTSKAPLTDNSLTLSAQFKKSSDEWECDVCMIRNKKQSDKCVACETARKGAPESNSLSAGKWQSNSFGEAFKPKANTWECPTCLINNKSDCSECIACQTKKPGSASEDSSKTAPTTNTIKTTFKFGFSNVDSKSSGQSTAQPDSGFKSIAASQMSAKWECDACMTRNDAARNKCVCCEQAKPGTTTSDFPDNGPKFTFGSAASSKFTFGFGTSVNGTTTSDIGAVKTSVAGSNQKTGENSTKGLVLENTQTTTQPPSVGTSFTFGIKSTPATSEKDVSSKNTENKDVADSGNNSAKKTAETNISGFKFGSSTIPESKDLSTKPNFQFGAPASTPTSTMTSSPAPAVKFGFGDPVTTSVNANVGESKQQSNSNDELNSKPATGGFAFGNSKAPAALQSTSGFSFGTGTTTTAKSTTTTSTTFAFGTSTSTTQHSEPATTTPSLSTATVKPMFSFGSNTTSTTQATESKTLSTITSTTTTTPSAFSKPTVGFSFGSGATGSASASASSAAKPIFGSFSSPTTISGASAAISSAPNTANSTFATAPKNVFGTFGESSLTAKTTSTSATPISSSTAPASANLFGSASQNVASTISGESKPIASATMIFGSTGSGTSSNKTTAGAPFVFGSSTSNANAQGTSSNTTTSGNVAAPATGWPKGGFAFGAPAINSGTQNTSESAKPVFGSFASAGASSTAGASGSMFGNLVSSGTNSAANSTFGSAAAGGSAVRPSTMFGANTSNTTPATQTTPNLFGSVSAAPSAFGAPPTFGNAGNNTSNSTPTFGAASSATFGSFGSSTSNTGGDGASAPKKSEPAFNFGGNSSQIASNSGFSFGMQANAAAKPAFNFTASNAPAFNFTGSSSDAAKPFQFGATPPAPVFNFSSGAVEATPNAPFQFNAGTAPASSNIFAPTPSASSAPVAMQARRKIRQPARRLPPR